MRLLAMLCAVITILVPYFLLRGKINPLWFILIFAVELVILWTFLFLMRKAKKRKDKARAQLTPEEEEEYYQDLFQEFNIPEEHIKLIVMRNTLYNLQRCPVIAWKVYNVIYMLPMKEPPYIIRRPCEWFWKLEPGLSLSVERDGEDDWEPQDNFIKKEFAGIDEEYLIGNVPEDTLCYLGKFVLAPESYRRLKDLLESDPPAQRIERSLEDLQDDRW